MFIVQLITGHERIVELLIRNGADVNLREVDGWAALNIAAWKGIK